MHVEGKNGMLWEHMEKALDYKTQTMTKDSEGDREVNTVNVCLGVLDGHAKA